MVSKATRTPSTAGTVTSGQCRNRRQPRGPPCSGAADGVPEAASNDDRGRTSSPHFEPFQKRRASGSCPAWYQPALAIPGCSTTTGAPQDGQNCWPGSVAWPLGQVNGSS